MRNNQKTQGEQCAGREPVIKSPVVVPGLCVAVNLQANLATVGEKTGSLVKNYGLALNDCP